MKKFIKAYKIEICAALCILCAAAIVIGWDGLQTNPMNRSITIEDPSSVFYAEDGREYIIAEGATEIVALDEEYRYLLSISGGQEDNGFYYAQTLASDDRGNLYVHDKLLNENGKDIEVERIAMYNSSGVFQDYLYKLLHVGGDGENRNRIYGLRCQDNQLWFIRVDMNDFALCRLDLETGKISQQMAYWYPDARQMLMDFVIDADFTVFFSDKFGAIWRADGDGDYRCLYAGADHSTDLFYSIATDLACGADGSIWFNDVGTREIRRILPDGTIETMLSQGEPLEVKPEGFTAMPIYSSLTVTENGVMSTICSIYHQEEELEQDEYYYEYQIYSRNAEGEVLLNTCEIEKSVSIQVTGWIGLLGCVLLIVILVYLVICALRSDFLSRISPSGRIQLAVIISILISTVTVATIVINEMYDRYLLERTNNVTNLAMIMARDLRAEDIESIDAPSDYGGEAYQRIDETIKNIINSGVSDAGTYITLYKEHRDIVCVIYSDEGLHNVMYPMGGSFEGSIEEGIYQTGELRQFSAFSSADGHYTFTLAPITDGDDNVIGLIEVGADLYAVTAADEAFVRGTILIVLMVAITAILLFSESTIFVGVLKRNRRERQKGLLENAEIVRPIAFLIFFAGNMSTAFLPVYGMQLWSRSMHIQQEVAIALPLSAEVLLTAVFSLLGGFVVDRMSAKRMAGFGGVIYAAGLAMCGIVPNLWGLIGSSVVLGIGEGIVLVSLNTFIASYREEEQRNRGFSGYNAAYLSGVNCGTVVGSLAAERFGYRPVFYIAGAVAVAALLLAVTCLHKQTPVAQAAEEEKSGMSTLRFLFRPRIILFFLFMLIPYLICASFLSYFFPIYGEENGLSTTIVAQAFLLSGVIAIYLGPVLTKLISERLGARGGLILSTGIYVSAFVFFAASPSIASCFIIIALLAVADCFGLSMQAIYFSALPEVRQYGAGKAMGVNSTMESIAQTVGPMIFAGVLMLGVKRGVMLLAVGVGAMLLVFTVSALLDRRKEDDKEVEHV